MYITFPVELLELISCYIVEIRIGDELLKVKSNLLKCRSMYLISKLFLWWYVFWKEGSVEYYKSWLCVSYLVVFKATRNAGNFV